MNSTNRFSRGNSTNTRSFHLVHKLGSPGQPLEAKLYPGHLHNKVSIQPENFRLIKITRAESLSQRRKYDLNY
jgi:hypothetical protein